MFEKVNPSHPDKVADRIAGAIVDLAYSWQENPKIAVEVLLGHGSAYIIIESDRRFVYDDISPIVDRICGKGTIGTIYLKSNYQDKHLADNQEGTIRCGDNGIFKGCPVTEEQQVLTHLASEVYKRFPYDGKYIIQGARHPYRDFSTGKEIPGKYHNLYGFTICQSHCDHNQMHDLIEELPRTIFPPVTIKGDEDGYLPWHYDLHQLKFNPLGPWTGGLDVDSGATNRKLGSDMGDGVTGGGLHGKDLSKADASVNIWCHLEAQRTGKPVTACCAIGDQTVNGIPYEEIVAQAREYINSIGGFEKFAEWGLIRPE